MLNPQGFDNKAWGRRDNGAPQESLRSDLNPSGVPQSANTAVRHESKHDVVAVEPDRGSGHFLIMHLVCAAMRRPQALL